MKVTVEKEVEAAILTICVKVFDNNGAYDFTDIDSLNLNIDLNEGRVLFWTCGVSCELTIPIAGENSYTFQDSEGNYAGRQSQQWCPSQVLPVDEENDAIRLRIAGDGKILNWPERLTAKRIPW